MASKDLDRDDIEQQELDDIDLTTCCICTEIYTDPKVLPCIHTFCMKCIQETGLKTNTGPGDEMPCPICRRMFKIPAEGFHDLPKNLFIDKLIQVANVSYSSTVSRVVCDACLDDENEETGKEIPLAEKYCADCSRKLCEECCIEHRNFKLTKKHELMPMSEFESGQKVMINIAPSVCELHEQAALNVYCTDCKTVVCSICFIDDHSNHKGSHVKKYVPDFRKQIESSVEAMNEYRSVAETKRAELMKLKKDIQERVKNLESDVEKRKEEVKQLAEKHATTLLQDLCSIRQSKMKEIQLETDDIDTHLSSLETYTTCCQNVMSKGSDTDLCCAFSDLSSRAVELKQQCQLTNEIDIKSFDFSFGKSELEQFLAESCDNLIGELHEEGKSKLKKTSREIVLEDLLNLRSANEQFRIDIDNEVETNKAQKIAIKVLEDSVEKLEQELSRIKKDQLRYISDPVLIQAIRSRATENEKICGLTILDKELFFVCEDSSEVEVYDSIELSFSRRWNLEELFYPVDLGSCQINKCLYILDYRGDDQPMEILRVDPDGNLIKKWSTGNIWSALSVTDEANVILTDYDTNKLNEYSPDGQLICEINLSSDAYVCCVRHALKLANDLFVVSHGYFDAGVDDGGSGDIGGWDDDEEGVRLEDDGGDFGGSADDDGGGDFAGDGGDFGGFDGGDVNRSDDGSGVRGFGAGGGGDDDDEDDDDDYEERDYYSDNDYDHQRVCIVDADGKLKKSFGGERGSHFGELNDPVHLFVDRYGFIMVVDRGNSRVILLDSNLELKREILSKEKHGLQHPSRILLDEFNGRLFVVDNEWTSGKVPIIDGRILIFDL